MKKTQEEATLSKSGMAIRRQGPEDPYDDIFKARGKMWSP